MKFIHTADWQIGKPFARIGDAYKRSLVQQARIEAITRIGSVVKDTGAELVMVAGDLFDSRSADKATVSAACSAIGQIAVPVIAIPGNHDHGGPGSVWEQDFFRREHEALAPNLTVLLAAEPHVLDSAVVLPCPLMRRTHVGDPTEWLRAADQYAALPDDMPRIVLAHGSTQGFSGRWDDEDGSDSVTDVLDLERIPGAEVDYVALGDWHGTKEVSPKIWYPGTPEPDRFPKGGGHEAGNVLVVEVVRGGVPAVGRVRTGRLNWLELSFDLTGDAAPTELERRLSTLLGQRAAQDLLHLTLAGSIGIDASDRMEQIIEYLDARLLRLKLVDRTQVAPTPEEIDALTRGGVNPLISAVALQLAAQTAEADEERAAVARVALKELYAACAREKA